MLSYGFESGYAGLQFLLGMKFGIHWHDLLWVFILVSFIARGVHICHTAKPWLDGNGRPNSNSPDDEINGRKKKAPVPGALVALAVRIGSTPGRLIALCIYLIALVGPAIYCSLFLGGEWWSHLSYKHPQITVVNYFRHTDDMQSDNSPTEYEACEFVRYNAYVRAPVNAWSSFAFASAPTYVILFANLWDPLLQAIHGQRKNQESVTVMRSNTSETSLTQLFGCLQYMQIVLVSSFLCWVSFLYHSSITNEMNYIDVRGMFLTAGFTMMLDAHTIVRRAAWRTLEDQDRLLHFVMEQFVIPVFCAIAVLYDVTVLFTDYFSHRFNIFIPIMFLSNVLFSFWHARHFRVKGAETTGDKKLGYNRVSRRYLIAGVLFIIGVLCKFFDDTKLMCFSSLRTTPFQLTGLFHILLGVSGGYSSAAYVESIKLQF